MNFFERQLPLAVKSLFIIVVVLFGVLAPAYTAKLNHGFPRRANYFLHWSLNPSQVEKLAGWDLLILDMEVQVTSPDMLKELRRHNPDIILLAYITPQEIMKEAAHTSSAMRREFAAGLDQNWYLAKSTGERLSWWPGTELLNVSNTAPRVNGKRFNQYLPRFVANRIISSGLWDGVFYDNMWDNITYFAGSNIDFDHSGVPDQHPDALWQEGMRFIYTETRRLLGENYMIVGNGTTRAYADLLDGTMLENFVPSSWGNTMETYKKNHNGQQDTTLNIINANSGNTGERTNFKTMRFGLTSALMEDGYYSFDFGDKNHGQLWYYDEYDTDLGRPINGSTARNGHDTYAADVWRRDFQNGIAVVNSTDTKQRVALDGEFEKIHGVQDKAVNDGAIVSETTIDGYDGVVLLKTFAALVDALYTNGSFVRFFRNDGSRVRNGFFAFEEAYKGGDQVLRIDMDDNGKRDLLIVSGNRIMAWRDDGQRLLNIYPYTTKYTGKLRVAVGDIDGDKKDDIMVAPEAASNQPIKIYNRDGFPIMDDWYPFGQSYNGGYSVAIGNVDAEAANELVIGAGEGRRPEVFVYSKTRQTKGSWLAFEPQFRSGINVATGDTDGDGVDEIIVAPRRGGKPIIKLFDIKGNQQGSQIVAYSSFGLPGIDVRAVDIDFDGKDDIIGMSDDIGF